MNTAAIINNPWLRLQDIIGPANTYPRFIRRLFWKRELMHKDRFILVLFCWTNGASEDLLVEVLLFCGVNLTQSRAQHIGYLFRRLRDDQSFRRRYRSYNLQLRRWVSCD